MLFRISVATLFGFFLSACASVDVPTIEGGVAKVRIKPGPVFLLNDSRISGGALVGLLNDSSQRIEMVDIEMVGGASVGDVLSACYYVGRIIPKTKFYYVDNGQKSISCK